MRRLFVFCLSFGITAGFCQAQSTPPLPGLTPANQPPLPGPGPVPAPAPVPPVPGPAQLTAVPGAMTLLLPTDNDKLLRGDGPGFYMFVDRTFENAVTTPWEGGQFGYVRGPVRYGSRIAMIALHEGLDIAPLKRDAAGEPLDEVRAMSNGTVVHVSDVPGASNYGRYVVIQHDWGQGPFFSLYAHLSKITAVPGQAVQPGTPIAIMGHTGAGLDRRRSHLHVEMNLMLSTRFGDWHEGNFRPSPNAHGNYNGLNLSGFNLAKLFLARQVNSDLSAADFVRSIDPVWKLLIPHKGDLEILQRYPWLGEGTQETSASWEITLSETGLPLKIKPSTTTTVHPQVSWVAEREGLPISTYTRGYLTGNYTRGYLTGNPAQAALTGSGARFVKLLTGEFETPGPAPTAPAAVSKQKRK